MMAHKPEHSNSPRSPSKFEQKNNWCRHCKPLRPGQEKWWHVHGIVHSTDPSWSILDVHQRDQLPLHFTTLLPFTLTQESSWFGALRWVSAPSKPVDVQQSNHSLIGSRAQHQSQPLFSHSKCRPNGSGAHEGKKKEQLRAVNRIALRVALHTRTPTSPPSPKLITTGIPDRPAAKISLTNYWKKA